MQHLDVDLVCWQVQAIAICILLHGYTEEALWRELPYTQEDPNHNYTHFVSHCIWTTEQQEVTPSWLTWKPSSSKKVTELGRLATRLCIAALARLIRLYFSSLGFCTVRV